MINCALIGYGRWGKIIYSNIIKNQNLNLQVIFYNKKIDTKNIPKQIKISNNYKNFNYNSIKLIFIVANSQINYDLCKFFLLKKINIFIEKPITTNKKKIEELFYIAKKNNCILHVDYIHLFNRNFINFKKNVKQKILKKFKFKLRVVMGGNLIRLNQVDSYWDWGVHAFSILSQIINIDHISLTHFKRTSSNSLKINYLLKFDYGNSEIELNFGNNFYRKKIYVSYKDKVNNIKYYDDCYSINNKNYNSILQYKETPLQESFNKIITNIFDNRVYQCRTSKKITLYMEKLFYKYYEN